jgi:hypothetical protein
MVSTPKQAEGFSVQWLTEALTASGKLGDAVIINCRAVDSDIPGQTAEIVLLDVTYENNNNQLPEKMVAKITSRNPMILEQIIANYDQYRRETSFYREFPEVGIPVPECLYESHDPQSQDFVLLMSDLTPSTCPSWNVTAEQVELALQALPGLHAKWWNQPILKEKDWMVQNDNVAFYTAAYGAANAASPILSELYDEPELTQEIMAKLSGNMEKAMTFVASRSFTFVHGDYHAKQMFFPSDNGGKFAVIDWQFPFVAPGPWDFARMLGMCMDTNERRTREPRLQENYRQALSNKSVQGYSKEEFETDYKFGLAISQMIMSIASADTDPELFRIECEALGVDWREVMFNRTQKALDDWDVLSLIEQL